MIFMLTLYDDATEKIRNEDVEAESVDAAVEIAQTRFARYRLLLVTHIKNPGAREKWQFKARQRQMELV